MRSMPFFHIISRRKARTRWKTRYAKERAKNLDSAKDRSLREGYARALSFFRIATRSKCEIAFNPLCDRADGERHCPEKHRPYLFARMDLFVWPTGGSCRAVTFIRLALALLANKVLAFRATPGRALDPVWIRRLRELGFRYPLPAVYALPRFSFSARGARWCALRVTKYRLPRPRNLKPSRWRGKLASDLDLCLSLGEGCTRVTIQLTDR